MTGRSWVMSSRLTRVVSNQSSERKVASVANMPEISQGSLNGELFAEPTRRCRAMQTLPEVVSPAPYCSCR